MIRYNGKVPTKLTSWPKYERYVAPERFQEIARTWACRHRPPRRVWSRYARAVEELRDAVGIERSFQAQGVDEACSSRASTSSRWPPTSDQCAPANPRMPMIADMKTLMEAAYYGTSFEEVRAAPRRAAKAADSATAPRAAGAPAPAAKVAAPAGKTAKAPAKRTVKAPKVA